MNRFHRIQEIEGTIVEMNIFFNLFIIIIQ